MIRGSFPATSKGIWLGKPNPYKLRLSSYQIYND